MTRPQADATAASLVGAALFDVNVLVALSLAAHVHHHAAHAFLRRWTGRWATTAMTESACYRLLLNPTVTGTSHSAGDVDAVLRGMRSHPRCMFLTDDSSLAQPRVDTSVLVGHQLVTDLHLVNLAAGHEMTLVTFDRRLVAQLAPQDRHHVTLIPAAELG